MISTKNHHEVVDEVDHQLTLPGSTSYSAGKQVRYARSGPEVRQSPSQRGRTLRTELALRRRLGLAQDPQRLSGKRELQHAPVRSLAKVIPGLGAGLTFYSSGSSNSAALANFPGNREPLPATLQVPIASPRVNMARVQPEAGRGLGSPHVS